MAHNLDLTLPESVPEMEHYHLSPMDILPFALYAMCDLGDEDLESIRRQCTSHEDSDDEWVKLPAQTRFAGQSLQAIVDYHVQLGFDGEFNPRYFIVCVQKTCTTVLIVTLDDGDLDCKPNKIWTQIDKSALLLANLQIANTDWFEAKEAELEGPHDYDDDRRGSDNNNANDDDRWQTDESTDLTMPQHDDYGPAPPVGFHIQVYVIPGIDSNAIIPLLEPGSSVKKPDRSDWACKAVELPQESLHNPSSYASSLHPSQCLKHPTLEKKFFIVADEVKYEEDGVSIVRLDWDGNTEGGTEQQLLQFGHNLKFETQRAEVPETATRAAVGTLCMLAQGYLKWSHKVKQIAVYHPDTSDEGFALTQAIDPRWSKRGHGEQRVALGGSMTPEQIEEGGGFWPGHIHRQLAMCRHYKFVPEFVREYFIYCGVVKPNGSSDVLLVKLDWDGNLQQVEGLAANYMSTTTTVKVAASDAHKMFTDLVDGKIVWEGQAVA